MENKTRLNRRAKEIVSLQSKKALSEHERRAAVQFLRSIAGLAELTARLVESRSTSIENKRSDDDWLDVTRITKDFWTTAGSDFRFRLTHAGMAQIYDLHSATRTGWAFPNLEELGFKFR